MQTHISKTAEIIFPVFYFITVSRSGHIALDTRTTNWKTLGIIHGLPEGLFLHFPGLWKTMKPPVRSADDRTPVPTTYIKIKIHYNNMWPILSLKTS